ncbi:MAG: tripartite tricarboxylate transporter TctB family protein [Burkholderiales bacterium]|uniref:tripartite tricarboxylate transporter TctB family protein n=1 Tax=Inhella sp. TaxID=1921806 RepID=UPI001AD54994|nr:tripartite tricarboxylate transporter TctB family protein [Burkholderiales bacterium]
MKAKSQRDLFAGLLFVVTGVGFAYGSTQYDFGNSSNPGPGYFPFGLGVLLALLGALVLFKAMSIESRDGEPIGRIGWRPLLVVVGAIVLFALTLPRLGLPIAVVLTALLATRASRESRWLESALLALGLAAFCTAVFIGALKLNLPLWPIPLSRWGAL